MIVGICKTDSRSLGSTGADPTTTKALLPESPRHLIFQDKIPEARAAIASMNDTTHDSALVDEIMAEFTEGLRAENEGGKAGWMECFSPEVRMRTINGMMLQVSCLALSQT